MISTAQAVDAEQLLRALSRGHETLREMARALQKMPEVNKVQVLTYPFSAIGGPLVEMYVDVELKNGNAINWLFELDGKNGVWQIDLLISVNLNERGNTDAQTVRRWDEEIFTDGAALLVGVENACQTLYGSINDIQQFF